MDRLLTAEEIAERLGMRTDWVWAQARAGLIPHIRLGRYRRFRESAVEAWLRELEAKSTAVTPTAPTPLPLRRRASPRARRRIQASRRSSAAPGQFQKIWTLFGPRGAIFGLRLKGQKPRICGAFAPSGRQDLNLRPPGPQPGALPDCATPRRSVDSTLNLEAGDGARTRS
jgi:excisionase family DNA binding protein